MNLWINISQIFMNVVVGLSAIITPTLAYYGYKQWRRELRGKITFELARQVYVKLLNLFEVINELRQPFQYELRHIQETANSCEVDTTDIIARMYDNENMRRLIDIKDALSDFLKEGGPFFDIIPRIRLSEVLKMVNCYIEARGDYFDKKGKDPSWHSGEMYTILCKSKKDKDKYGHDLKNWIDLCLGDLHKLML